MSKAEKNEYQKYVGKRARELLRGQINSLPGPSCGGNEPDSIYGPVLEAINRAYVQGWIDSEIDLVKTLFLRSGMRDEPEGIEELWDIAHKKPKTEEAILHRRDWLEYEHAQDQLKLAGIDPYGKRPKPASAATPKPRAVKDKRNKKSKR